MGVCASFLSFLGSWVTLSTALSYQLVRVIVRLGHVVQRDAINVNRDIVRQSSIVHQKLVVHV